MSLNYQTHSNAIYKEQQVHNLRQNWVIEIVLRFGIKDV